MSDEIWKPIFDGRYEVSNFGNVKSHSRYKRGALLRQTLTRHGYKIAGFSLPEGHKTYAIHRLVAMAFIGDIPDHYQVNHKDGVKTNNHVDNLEIVTPQENAWHAWDNGLNKGVPHPERRNHSDLMKQLRLGLMADRKKKKELMTNDLEIDDEIFEVVLKDLLSFMSDLEKGDANNA